MDRRWWRNLNARPEQLDDLDSILNEPPPEKAASCSPNGSHAPETTGGAALPLPLSTQTLAEPSPEKRSQLPASVNSWANYVPPSIADWLPQQQNVPVKSPGVGWRGFAPTLHSGIPAGAAPPGAAAVPTAEVLEAAHGSRHLSWTAGFAPTSWAAHAQHQLSAACYTAAEQLAAAGTSVVGVSVLGAAVGGVVAGPLGVAAGAKSGAAIVAAGALGGATFKRLALSGSQAQAPGAKDLDRELQPLSATAAQQAGPPVA
jgi:hypothetical protein